MYFMKPVLADMRDKRINRFQMYIRSIKEYVRIPTAELNVVCPLSVITLINHYLKTNVRVTIPATRLES